MKKIILGALVLMVMLLAACSSFTVPVAATENPVGSKVGEATASYLGYFSYAGFSGHGIILSGDKSLSTAAANGGIQKIATVEQRIDATPFVTKITTIVTGN